MRAPATIVLALLGVHVALGALRVPTVVVGRRCADVAKFTERGAVRFHLDTEHRHCAEAVEWLLANVPETGIVLYRGDSKGAVEFVPALVAPRLLVRDAECPANVDTWNGHSLARRAAADGGRVLVLIANGDELRIEDR